MPATYCPAVTPSSEKVRLQRQLLSRAADLAVNVVLPFFHAYANLHDDDALAALAKRHYDAHPRLADNEVTRRMASELLGKRKSERGLFTTARRQQGLTGAQHILGQALVRSSRRRREAARRPTRIAPTSSPRRPSPQPPAASGICHLQWKPLSSMILPQPARTWNCQKLG